MTSRFTTNIREDIKYINNISCSLQLSIAVCSQPGELTSLIRWDQLPLISFLRVIVHHFSVRVIKDRVYMHLHIIGSHWSQSCAFWSSSSGLAGHQEVCDSASSWSEGDIIPLPLQLTGGHGWACLSGGRGHLGQDWHHQTAGGVLPRLLGVHDRC